MALVITGIHTITAESVSTRWSTRRLITWHILVTSYQTFGRPCSWGEGGNGSDLRVICLMLRPELSTTKW